jgi:hypothetical protein
MGPIWREVPAIDTPHTPIHSTFLPIAQLSPCARLSLLPSHLLFCRAQQPCRLTRGPTPRALAKATPTPAPT